MSRSRRRVRGAGRLPFTGLTPGAAALAGALLLGGGLALRRRTAHIDITSSACVEFHGTEVTEC